MALPEPETRVREFEFPGARACVSSRPRGLLVFAAMENCVRGGPSGRGAEPGALPLPPPPRLAAIASSSSSAAAAASIRAHLARSGSGVDCQASPRSLLSRILLRGGGDGGGGFRCRVPLPRRYGSGGGKEERKDGGTSEQGETPRVKVVERPPPELPIPIETPRSSLGATA